MPFRGEQGKLLIQQTHARGKTNLRAALAEAEQAERATVIASRFSRTKRIERQKDQSEDCSVAGGRGRKRSVIPEQSQGADLLASGGKGARDKVSKSQQGAISSVSGAERRRTSNKGNAVKVEDDNDTDEELIPVKKATQKRSRKSEGANSSVELTSVKRSRVDRTSEICVPASSELSPSDVSRGGQLIAQARLEGKSDAECMYDIVRSFTSDKRCVAFKFPVSTREAPGYTDVIERPMDFSTIRQKVQSGQYNSYQSFAGVYLYVMVCVWGL